MDDILKISLDVETKDSSNYTFLREEGLEMIRYLAASSWTDHNIHDPGITLLEGLSYALTEAGLLTKLEMADLLTSGESFAPQEFFTANKILPSSPVSVKDFQKVLIDHPLVNRAWVSLIYGEPLGRISALLEFEDMELNSNTISGSVVVGADTYNVDIVFPYWDDPEVLALQKDITLVSIDFIPVANPWQPISGSDAFFNRIEVNYFDGGPQSFEAWVVLLVTTPVPDPGTTMPLILTQASALLQTVFPLSNSIVKKYNLRVTKAFEASRHIRRYLKHYRNLCELIAEYRAVRIQEVAFTANIEVASGVDVESLLANIFFAVDSYVSPQLNTSTLKDLQQLEVDSASIFEGPLLDYGFIPEGELSTEIPLSKLYVSDIIRLIIQLRNPEGSDVQSREELSSRTIIAISNVSLALYLDNRSIITSAADCLQLINSTRHVPRLSMEKSKITFRRNNLEVNYDINRVIELVQEMQAAIFAVGTPSSPDLPIPKGNTFSIEDYYAVQNDLPITYGVGKAGLPATASLQRKAQARQLKGYLFFFEQILAGHHSQLARVNKLFSADPDLATTLNQQPIYHVPQIEDLFLDFDATYPTYQAFQADANNTYRQALRNGVESEDQFLDRRHRMLDHLLARTGEEMQEYTAMVTRLSSAIPNASSLPLPVLQAEQEKRRLQTLHRLIQDKSDFYYDIPELDHSRAQAFGLPSWRREGLIITARVGNQFGWQIIGYSGSPVLQHATLENTETEARRKAEEVLSWSTSTAGYGTVPDGGSFRISLRFALTGSPDAVSTATFASVGDALTATPALQQELDRTWIEFSLAPLELRMNHLLGMLVKGERRKLINAFTDYFEIFDDAVLLKRFRLRATTDPASTVLLVSQNNYPDVNAATAAANDAIKNGIRPENYIIVAVGPAFEVRLNGSDGNVIAITPTTFATIDLAKAALKQISQHLFRQYSVEGFYMVEHILLYPVADTDPDLIISDTIDPCQAIEQQRTDPYSFQLTFVFPSGYAKDFNLPEPPKVEIRPDKFRDLEFREYAERTIRKACPAHILPTVIWVDRALPDTAIPAGAPCFDNFETDYRNWINALFTDEVTEAVIGPLRNALVIRLNALFLANV